MAAARSGEPMKTTAVDESVRKAFVLGQFLGVTELIEKGLVTPAQFIDSCIRIKIEYEKQKEATK
jgi:hypothetical protein